MSAEPDYFTIKLPLFKSKDVNMSWTEMEQLSKFKPQYARYSCSISLVRPQSGLSAKRACEKLGCLFRTELGYDFRPFNSEGDGKYENILWHVYDFRNRPFGVGVVGMFFFGEDGEKRNVSSGWELSWVWFHPYFRGNGFLTAIWPYLEQKFGRFWVQHPLSPAMQAFISKIGYQPVIDAICDDYKKRHPKKS